MDIYRDILGRSVRLTDERKVHLESDHPEMAGQIRRIAETLANPDRIIRSRTDASVVLFYRLYQTTPVTTKFLCVVVKSIRSDNFVLTGYYTNGVKGGEVLWQRK
jgi:hypothetical protein